MNNDTSKLQIRCGNSDCGVNLHCYRSSKRYAQGGTQRGGRQSPIPGSSKTLSRSFGSCRTCGVQLVNWPRVHRRDITDAQHTFFAMRTEWIRHHFWHEPIDELAMNYARRKGRLGLRSALENRIRRAVGPATPFRDGYQTPYGQEPAGPNILYYAQHATAACCRKCVEEWHGIEVGRTLAEDEIQYLTNLGILYICERIGDLSDDAIRIPRRRWKLKQ
jgi:hypothetical protein